MSDCEPGFTLIGQLENGLFPNISVINVSTAISCLGKELRLRLYYKLLLELSLYFRTECFTKTIKGTELILSVIGQ